MRHSTLVNNEDTSLTPEPRKPDCNTLKRSAGALIVLSLLLAASPSRANQTWNSNPTNGDWNTAANWTPALVPGPSDIVTFSSSSITDISYSANSSAYGIVFNPGVSAYTLTVSYGYIFNIGIYGITNNSSVVQHFVSMPDEEGNAGVLGFVGAAMAGNQTEFNTVASTRLGGTSGIVSFVDTSSAGFGNYINRGSSVAEVSGGQTLFFFQPTADHGTFTNQSGSVSGAGGGETIFYSSS